MLAETSLQLRLIARSCSLISPLGSNSFLCVAATHSSVARPACDVRLQKAPNSIEFGL
jgi:hypothetical protein